MARIRRKNRLPLPPDVSGAPIPAPCTQRSSVTNGNRLYLEVRDRHSPWSRRLRDLIALQVSDLGGPENCSEAEKSLVRRAAWLSLQLELIEQKWAMNDGGEATAISLREYNRSSNTLRRILESLGLKRRSRDITPTLDQYLRDRAQEQQEAVE